MYVNAHDVTLPVTASATPTAYAIPEGTIQMRVFNDAGATAVIKPELSTVTLVAPVAGTKFNGTAMANQGVEIFEIGQDRKAVSVYSASGTGTVYLQFTFGK